MRARCGFIGRMFVSLGIVLLCSLIPLTYARGETLSTAEVSERFNQISSTYEPGERLSEEDSAFVQSYANSTDSTTSEISLLGSTNVNRSFTKYGVTANLSGSVWHNGVGYYEWGGDLTGRVSSGLTPRKMTVSVRVSSFGILPDGGTFLEHSDSISNTSTNSRTVSLYGERSYIGYASFYYVTSSLDVTTSAGELFSFEGNF